MSLINKEVADFSVQAYQNDDFHTVTKADILGKWSVFFFYPADFTFVSAARSSPFLAILTSSIRHGMTPPTPSRPFNTQCWLTQITP